jgi:hypothetical protein
MNSKNTLNLNKNQINAFQNSTRPIAEFYSHPIRTKFHKTKLNNIKKAIYYRHQHVKDFINLANAFINAQNAHMNKIPFNLKELNNAQKRNLNAENAKLKTEHARLYKLRKNTIKALENR